MPILLDLAFGTVSTNSFLYHFVCEPTITPYLKKKKNLHSQKDCTCALTPLSQATQHKVVWSEASRAKNFVRIWKIHMKK